jgi:hypothetical protein
MAPEPAGAAQRARDAIAAAFAAINDLPHDGVVRSNTMTGGDIAATAQQHLAAACQLVDIYDEGP